MSEKDREIHPKPTPMIVWTPSRFNANQITARLQGATGQYALSMGQGEARLLNPSGTGSSMSVLYPENGSYMIYAYHPGDKKTLGTAQVGVRGSFEAEVTITRSTEPGEPYTYLVAAEDDHTQFASRFTIDWGSLRDQETEQVWLAPGQSVKRDLKTGTDEVIIHDDHTKRQRKIELTVDSPNDPDYTVDKDPADPTGHTVLLTLSKVSSKTVLIDWGDQDETGHEQVITNPTEGQEISHAYTGQPNFPIRVSYQDGSGKPVEYPITIPWVD